MTDDLFLKVGYFGMAGTSLLLGWGVYLALRRSFAETLRALLHGSRSIGRILLFATLVSSFSGFLSVSMPGCPERRYEEIVSDRSYVIRKMKEQASTAMRYLVDCLLVTGFGVGVLLSFQPVADRRRRTGAERDDGAKNASG